MRVNEDIGDWVVIGLEPGLRQLAFQRAAEWVPPRAQDEPGVRHLPPVAWLRFHSGVRIMSISSRSPSGASRNAPGQRPISRQPSLA